jgi:hypothetical protein
VLVQCFERRCLTFTPDNSPESQVEAGNIGQHYYLWRYGSPVDETFAPLLPSGISGPAPEGPPGCVSINEAGIQDLVTIVHIDRALAEQVIRTRPHMYLDSMGIATDLTLGQIEDIYAEGVACV